jgi:hypothetical protein
MINTDAGGGQWKTADIATLLGSEYGVLLQPRPAARTTRTGRIPFPTGNIYPLRTIAAEFVRKTSKQTIAVALPVW